MVWLPGLILALALGCDGEPATVDASPDSAVGEDASLPTPAPPAPAAPPVLTPCPDGWNRTGDAAPFGCEPWPSDSPPDCTGASARFPGMAACALLGTPCAADGWPTDLPADAIFVDADAPAGGDGTRALPHASITEALATASAGQTIAIGVGDYAEAIDVPSGVSLVGACVESTVLHDDAARFDRGVITVVGSDVVVRNLRIARSEQAGLWIAGTDRSVHLEDVLIEDALLAGVNAEQGAVVTADRLVVRRPRPTVLGTFGRGLTIETGSTATIRRLVVEDAVELGVVGIRPGTVVALEDAVISGTSPIPGEVAAGGGLLAFDQAEVTANRVVLEGNTTVGAGAQGGSIALWDSLVRMTRSRPVAGELGRGAEAQLGGTVSLERVALEDNRDSAIMAVGEESRARVVDVIVRRTLPDVAEARHGWGIGVQGLGHLEGDRIHIERSREAGFVSGGLLPASVDVRDLTIVDTLRGNPSLSYGRGISVQRGTFDAARLSIERCFGEGILVTDEAEATLTDVSIADVVPIDEAVQPSGRAVFAMFGGRVIMERAELGGTWDAALAAMLPGSLIDASDVRIDGVRAVECDADTCAPGGHGVFAYFESEARLRRFVIESSETCGVHVAEQGTISLSSGVVRGASIGACVQSDSQDLGALQDDVSYVDNGISLDATMLPVPEPPSAL